MATAEKKYLSQEKHKELMAELEYLKSVKRKEIAEQLEYAKSLGDMSENAEYNEARDNQANVEGRILQIEAILKIAEIVKERGHDQVDIGSTVVLKDAKENKETRWHIVGSEEADLSQSKISNESPLGAALLGRKEGDTFEIKTPRGKIAYTIVKIS